MLALGDGHPRRRGRSARVAAPIARVLAREGFRYDASVRLLCLACLVAVACSGASPAPARGDASASPDAAPADAASSDVGVDIPADTEDDDAGSSWALTGNYTHTDCVMVEAVAFNDGGIRQNEICDRGRSVSPRYATVRGCAAGLTSDADAVRRIADEGAYMNPTRHPENEPPCSRFTVLYPIEQVQRAIWCLRHTASCNTDGSPR